MIISSPSTPSLSIVNNFRLTLTSGTPVTVSDVTYATTMYLTPYNGNLISLYDGSSWSTYQTSEISLALGTLTNATGYDVFCYANNGVPTLEFTAWANTTTRATALVYQNGILCKSGALTRRYLGSFYNPGNQSSTVTMTIAAPGVITYTAHGLSANAPVVFTTSGALPTGIVAGTTYYVASAAVSAMTANTFQISATPGGTPITTTGSQSGTHTCTVPTYTEGSQLNRYLFNCDNQVPRQMTRTDAATSWTYTTNTIRQSNGSLMNQVNFFLGIDSALVTAAFHNDCSNTLAGTLLSTRIGLDSTTAGAGVLSRCLIYQPTADSIVAEQYADCAYVGYPGIGKHYLSMLEQSAATGTTTWRGGQSVLSAVLMG